jgi:serine/threonine-protein kinase RsbW
MKLEGPNTHSIVVESKASAAAGVCRQILSELQQCGYTKEDAFAIHLAMEEAFVNAVKHGNKMDPSKKVVVDYCIDHDKVQICITDEGSGFNPDGVPDPRFGRNLYKPNGRGLLLIRSYMDVVRYSERGNTVCLMRYKERPQVTARRDLSGRKA